MNQWKNFTKGFIKENPVFVLLLGMCPTLGTTGTAINGLGMGLATTFVLVMSNLVVSLIKNMIPDKVRIPAFIVVIATFVTIVEMVMQAYLPSLYESLGLFIPLIVVNCIVLGRAEAFASKNTIASSVIDGLGIGFGFAFALTILGSVREFLGAWTVFGYPIVHKIKILLSNIFGANIISTDEPVGMLVFILAPGAFIALGYIIAVINRLNKKNA